MGNGPGRGGGVAHGGNGSVSTLPAVRVVEIKLAGHFMIYENSDTRPNPRPIRGNFRQWGQGDVIRGSHWARGRESARAVVQRNTALRLRVTLEVAPTSGAALSGTLQGRAQLDGDGSILSQPASGSFTFAAGAARCIADLTFPGTLPNEIGRLLLTIDWTAAASPAFRFIPTTSSQRIYLAYDTPVQPDYDSNVPNDTGASARVGGDTVSGTQRRLDKLMSLLGSSQRHPVTNAAELNQAIWKIHRGINDNSPPWFDGNHARHISDDGGFRDNDVDDAPHDYHVQHQWLMWADVSAAPGAAQADRFWNDGSCIGHVQLLKTMVAAIGLFARRAWVFPTTTLAPRAGQASSAWSEPRPR